MTQRSFPASFWNSNYQAPKCANGVSNYSIASTSSSSSSASMGHSHHDLFSQV